MIYSIKRTNNTAQDFYTPNIHLEKKKIWKNVSPLLTVVVFGEWVYF